MTVALAVEGVSKRFGGLNAVQRVAFTVAAGQILGLIGPNGAGKTTLFNIVTGFIRQDTGRVLLDGRSVDGWSPERRCGAGLCRTFQVVKPFGNISVLDNVVMGAMGGERTMAGARAWAREVLRDVGLLPRAGVLARTLPVGERKRLELARALATRPRVLLLDEVMSGLIPAEIQETIALLRTVNAAGVTIVLIEHIMSAVMALSDRIVVLHYGEAIAEGAPAEIVKDPRVLAAYLGDEYIHARG